MLENILKQLYTEADKILLNHKQLMAAIHAIESTLGKNATLTGINYKAEPSLFSENDLEVGSPPITLKDHVKSAIALFNGAEFTVPMIDNIFKKQGIDLKGNAKVRISVTLTKLMRDGFITRTRPGAGKTPHTYKIKSNLHA